MPHHPCHTLQLMEWEEIKQFSIYIYIMKKWIKVYKMQSQENETNLY